LIRNSNNAAGLRLILAALVFAVPGETAGAEAGAEAEAIIVSTTPLPFHPERPERDRVGRLLWRGGLELKSQAERFGGLSSLVISDDRTRLTAASDDGSWFQANLSYAANGDLAGLSNAVLTPIADLTGAALADKRWRDAESLTRLTNGDLLLSFERNHRVWRYGAAGAVPTALPTPPPLTRTFGNGGIEALVTLKDGRVLAITEAQELAGGQNQVAAYLWDGRSLAGDRTWTALRYQREGDFKPTGAARLPSGDLLVLERSFSPFAGVAIRLRSIAQAEVVPGRTLKGREIAVIRPPLAIDNMEGIEVKSGPDGETLVYLLSDDNFSILQRSLLLMFELRE
jgi:hypothetical protein